MAHDGHKHRRHLAEMKEMEEQMREIEDEAIRAELNRRRFLTNLGRGAAGLALGSAAFGLLTRASHGATAAADAATSKALTNPARSASARDAGQWPCDLSVTKGDDPALNCRKAVDALGSMKRFVKKGDVVVVKPNIGWDRTPEMAANTNPAVVAALIAMALDAGAAKVKVFDRTCNNPKSCYVRSGIQGAAEKAGALVLPFEAARCRKVKVPNGEFLKEWPVYPDALECDCFINVPVAKVHGSSRVSLGMKNMMGVIGGNRGEWHQSIHAALAEFVGVIKSQLTVIDAYRIMVKNGPTGGLPADLQMPKTCIASADPVAADARGALLFDIQPKDLDFIVRAAKMGYGEMELSKVRVKEVV